MSDLKKEYADAKRLVAILESQLAEAVERIEYLEGNPVPLQLIHESRIFALEEAAQVAEQCLELERPEKVAASIRALKGKP